MRMMTLFGHDKTFTQPIVWVTTFFMMAFHIGALAALFVFSWEALFACDAFMVVSRGTRHRHGIPSSAHASRL